MIFCMFSYPVFLTLKGRKCLVAGLGQVGLRKLQRLCQSNPARIVVFDKKPLAQFTADVRDLLNSHDITYFRRSPKECDIMKCFLVFACTDDFNENSRIVAWCNQHNILCNSVTNPEDGDFIVPALAASGEVSVALSTSGASPMAAKNFRYELTEWCRDKNLFVSFLKKLRPLVLECLESQKSRALFFQQIYDSPFHSWLKEGDKNKCLQWLYLNLPPNSHEQAAKLFAEN